MLAFLVIGAGCTIAALLLWVMHLIGRIGKALHDVLQ